MEYLKNPRNWVIASFVVGFVLSMTGWALWDMQTPQTQLYNAGIVAYNSGNYEVAVEDFDRSYSAYQDAAAAASNPLHAGGSLEMAALSQFQKFKALLKMKNAKLAVISIKEALKLTTAYNLSHYQLSDRDLARIQDERVIYQTDLEILFHQKKQMQDGEGKGKGNQNGKPGDKQSEDPSQPGGNAAGHGDRDAL